MRCLPLAACALASLPAAAQTERLARPELVLKTVVPGMPTGPQQEIRVMTAMIKPGDRTPFHTHRFPVTVHVIEGAFTLEMQGRTAVTVKAGESLLEPPNVKMTGYNRGNEMLKVVIFYVSEPDTPFLDPVR